MYHSLDEFSRVVLCNISLDQGFGYGIGIALVSFMIKAIYLPPALAT